MKFVAMQIFLLLFLIGSLNAQTTGTITGTVIDESTGDALIGATIMVEGQSLGALSKLDGTYRIANVPAGTYNLNVTFLGYTDYKITNVNVKPGEVIKIDAILKTEDISMGEIEVTAEAANDSEAGLIKQRQKSISISDAVSSELISRTGSGDVASAMEKVTGVTIVDGKKIYVRGLGDRYMNTSLNGASLPNADPDNNSVSTDIFSSKFIDNITTVKSFTPDKPGNFTGGTVDIKTKSFPDRETFNFSISSSYNTVSSMQDDFLTYSGSSTDWMGFDNGSRDIPSIVNEYGEIPYLSEARFDKEKAEALNDISKAFIDEMAPTMGSSGLNQSWGLSYGNQYELLGNQFGIIAGVNYSNNYKSYADGISGQYNLTGKVSETETLNNIYRLNDSKGSFSANWGGMLNMAYEISDKNKISLNYMINHSGEKTARYLHGYAQTLGNPYSTYETRTLAFTERNVSSVQLNGEHFLESVLSTMIDWNVTYSGSNRNEPNMRFFVNDYTPFEVDGDTVNLYSISASNYSEPSHYYRDLNESLAEGNLNLSIPFEMYNNLKSNFKFGTKVSVKDRNFTENIYKMQREPRTIYNGDPATFFSDSLVGILSYNENSGRYTFGNYITDQTQPGNSYTGLETLFAYYGMFDFQLTSNLKMIAGVRYEMNDMDVKSADSTKNFRTDDKGNVIELGRVKTDDLLPSLNFVYQLQNNMNLRASYGKTLARPSFREMATYPSFDFIGGYILNGNQELKRTLIDNYDLRWEWFMNPGEILAVSTFYKDFTNPIEMAIVSNNNQIQYQNVDNGITYGVEFESRFSFRHFADYLSDFSLGANLTLVKSEVDIPEKDMITKLELDPNASTKRELQGQSPYVVNLMLNYDNLQRDLHFNLSFNVFGKRLSKVSLGGTPNVYEYPRPILDFNSSYKIYDNIKVGFSANNILDSKYTEAISYNGRDDYYVARYSLGRTFSLSIGYEF
jgi:TonB-dependent receptor